MAEAGGAAGSGYPRYYGLAILLSGGILVLASGPGHTIGLMSFLDFIVHDLKLTRSSVSLR